MKKLTVIYITGLGNSDKKGQRLVVKFWRLYGVKPVFCDMCWGEGVWDEKFQRLLKLVDDSEGPVALVGVSAGASAAINAYAARKDRVSGVVLLAGWVNRPQDVGAYHYEHNPAFVDSAKLAPESLAKLDRSARQRILSRYAYKDWIVSAKHSMVEGAHNERERTKGHGFTIATQILFGAPSFLKFLKRQTKIK